MFPKVPLLLAFVLTVILLVGVCVLFWLPDERMESNLISDFRIQEIAGDILYLDEVLTMSARMAAATGDTKWEDRYRRHEPELDTAIREAMTLSRAAFMTESAAKTFGANVALVEMENEAFDLVRQGDLEAATALLYSEEYEEQKKTYSDGLESISTSLRDGVNQNLNAHRNEDRIVLAFFLGGLIIAALFWTSLLAQRSLTSPLSRNHHRADSRQS